MQARVVMLLSACLGLCTAPVQAQPVPHDPDGGPWPIGDTPGSIDTRVNLQRAAARGDVDKVKELLVASPNPEDVRRALLLAAIRRKPEAVQLLKAANPPIDIFTAAATGDLPNLRLLIERNSANANAHDKLVGRSVLSWAVRAGQKEAVEFLLAHKANVNDRAKTDHFGDGVRISVVDDPPSDKRSPFTEIESPLWSALDNGSTPIDPEMVHLLLEHGADANERGPANISPLARAASKGNVQVIDDLVAHKAKAKTPEIGGTPLLAYAFASRDATARLLKHGADPNGKFPGGDPLLDVAVDTPETGAADELIKGGAKVTFKAACVLGRVDDAHTLLQRTPALAVREIDRDEHEGPIFFAARFNQPEIIKLLLDAGAHADSKNRFEQNPVHVASSRGSTAAVAALIDRGVKVDAECPGGRPINLAAAANKAETVRLLLDRGAKVNEPARLSGQTPLVSAANTDADEAAALLIARGADVNQRYGELKQAPLHAAAWAASVKVTRLLLDKGADRAAADARRNTPLALARAGGASRAPLVYTQVGESARPGSDAQRRQLVIDMLTAPAK